MTNSSELVLVQGFPGSGKSSAVEAYVTNGEPAGYDHLEHYSVGNHLRGIIAGDIPSLYTMRVIAESKKLAQSQRLDDNLVNAVVSERLMSIAPRSLTFVDGYPLYVEQVEEFEKNIHSSNVRILGLIEVEVSPEVAVERILRRGTRNNEDAASRDFATRRINEHIRDSTETTTLLARTHPIVKINGLFSLTEVAMAIGLAVQAFKETSGE